MKDLKQITASSTNKQIQLLKRGIWAYFLLLIFEGAIRKWILPGLATPLLIVRDPVALWLVLTAWHRGWLPSNIYMGGTAVVGLLAIITAGLFGHGSVPVALYGARILLIHFPLMFVIGRLFTREDVVQLAKVSLWIAIPMAILIFLQFHSPQSALVNRGVGGDMAGAGYSGAMGYFRPSGTFSFTNGTTNFFTFVAPFICFFWISNERMNKAVLIAATIALLLSIPLSISRSLFFGVIVTFLFAILSVSRKPKYLGKILMATVFILIALTILSKTDSFSTSVEVFTARLDDANKSEGGVEGVFLDRYLGGMVGALFNSPVIPFWGYGIGLGTNVGSMLLSGTVDFLISEGEWGRLVGEMGPIMGIFIIILRIGFCVVLTKAGYKQLSKGDLLPWLLLSNLLIVVPQGQWAQPTSLGFSTLIGGLVIASLNNYNSVPPYKE